MTPGCRGLLGPAPDAQTFDGPVLLAEREFDAVVVEVYDAEEAG